MKLKKKERTKRFKEGGKRGGQKTLEMRGKNHFHEIGKKGARKRWNKNLVEEAPEELDNHSETV